MTPSQDMAQVFNSYASSFQFLFHEKLQHRQSFMNYSEFYQFAVDHNLCPNLLSRLRLTHLFQECLTAHHPPQAPAFPQHNTTENSPRMKKKTVPPLDPSERVMSYKDFITTLGQMALVVFSGLEWARTYPRECQKLRLLLFCIDQRDEYFKGNTVLLSKLIHDRKTDDHDPSLSVDNLTFSETGATFTSDHDRDQQRTCPDNHRDGRTHRFMKSTDEQTTSLQQHLAHLIQDIKQETDRVGAGVGARGKGQPSDESGEGDESVEDRMMSAENDKPRNERLYQALSTLTASIRQKGNSEPIDDSSRHCGPRRIQRRSNRQPHTLT